jgi:hypothetical protein
MSQDWNIKSRSHTCAVSGEPFVDGADIYSCLFFGEEGYTRADISTACWNDEQKNRAVSFWRTAYTAPPPPTDEPLKKENVETLLRQFMSREDDSRLEVVYILAVMLERKRLLVERDVQRREDGTKLRIYEHRQTGEIFTVPDPDLRLDQIEGVQRQVNELLGIPPPPGASPAPAPPEAPAS